MPLPPPTRDSAPSEAPEHFDPHPFGTDDPATFYLLTSLTSGSSTIITATARLEHLLKSHKIAFKSVDCATDQKAKRLWKWKGKGRRLPGVVRDGVVLGNFEELEEWNEYGELKQNLGIKKTKKKKKSSTGGASGIDLDGKPGAAKPVKTAKPNVVDEREEDRVLAGAVPSPFMQAQGQQSIAEAAAAIARKRGRGIKTAVGVVEGKEEKKTDMKEEEKTTATEKETKEPVATTSSSVEPAAEPPSTTTLEVRDSVPAIPAAAESSAPVAVDGSSDESAESKPDPAAGTKSEPETEKQVEPEAIVVPTEKTVESEPTAMKSDLKEPSAVEVAVESAAPVVDIPEVKETPMVDVASVEEKIEEKGEKGDKAEEVETQDTTEEKKEDINQEAPAAAEEKAEEKVGVKEETPASNDKVDALVPTIVEKVEPIIEKATDAVIDVVSKAADILEAAVKDDKVDEKADEKKEKEQDKKPETEVTAKDS